MRARSSREAVDAVVVASALDTRGLGVARGPDGRVVFVAGLLPGERAWVQPTRIYAHHWEGRVTRLLDRSWWRTPPVCPYFGRCGGCTLQHAAYPQQWRWKVRDTHRQLRRLARRPLPQPTRLHPSPTPYGWRRWLRLHLGERGLGFRARGGRRLVVVDRCPVADPRLEATLAALQGRRWLRRAREDGWTQWELRVSDDGAVELILEAPTGGGERARRWANRLVQLPELAGVTVGGYPRGRTGVRYRVEDLELDAPPGAFLQAHTTLNQVLVARVLHWIPAGEPVVDLYAGAGNFALPLHARGAEVVAVESNPRAARALRAQAGPGLHVIQGDAAHQRPDPERWYVLDPPREGALAVTRRLAGQPPRGLVYVSCHPAALVRDLEPLLAAGMELVAWEYFDLFPQTGHLEVLAVLRRADAGR